MEKLEENVPAKPILVPSVKELAKQSMINPPSRYKRHVEELSHASVGIIPIIDMQKLVSEETMKSEQDKLDLACKEWGFFQLLNHGVDVTLVEKLKHELEEFFDLPEEEKKKFWRKENDIEGFGQTFVFSDDQKLDWADTFFMVARPKTMRKPHLFPKLPQLFREALDVYSSEINNLAMSIFGIMEKALKMDEKEMTNVFEDGYQSIRMNYYPPSPQSDRLIGFTPHSDPEGLAFLVQVDETEGLQVKKDGGWIPVTPLSNAIIVNVGDALQVITNGIYRSIEHRATINSVKERISFVAFSGPKVDAMVGPAQSLVGPSTPALYQNVLVKDYLGRFYSHELKGKSNLEAMKTDNDMPQFY